MRRIIYNSPKYGKIPVLLIDKPSVLPYAVKKFEPYYNHDTGAVEAFCQYRLPDWYVYYNEHGVLPDEDEYYYNDYDECTVLEPARRLVKKLFARILGDIEIVVAEFHSPIDPDYSEESEISEKLGFIEEDTDTGYIEYTNGRVVIRTRDGKKYMVPIYLINEYETVEIEHPCVWVDEKLACPNPDYYDIPIKAVAGIHPIENTDAIEKILWYINEYIVRERECNYMKSIVNYDPCSEEVLEFDAILTYTRSILASHN